MKEASDTQREQWERSFAERPDMFGNEPSEPALAAAGLFEQEGVTSILELGGGQGRDTFYFAQRGIRVHMLDYSMTAVAAIAEKAERLGVSGAVGASRHDVRQPLPFDNNTFDACYSHMLFCMALTTAELERLSQEILRVLRPGGLHVYTVRHRGDAHYEKGTHLGENIYEFGGFAVHFFSREMVNHLAAGCDILGIEEFEEGALPRKLFLVALRKKSS